MQNFTGKKNEHCCVVQMHGLEHTWCFQRFRTMLPFFGCPKFSVWVYNTSDVPTGQAFTINWSKIQLSWVLMLYYLYKMMFSIYKSVIVTPCACDLFVRKVTKITWYMDVRFWRSFFQHFFSVWWILKSTTAWLLKLSVLYIHSFMHIHIISNKNSFQQCFIFNWSACITPCMCTFWH